MGCHCCAGRFAAVVPLWHVSQAVRSPAQPSPARGPAPRPLPLPLRRVRQGLLGPNQPTWTPLQAHGRHGVQVHRLSTRVPLRAAAEVPHGEQTFERCCQRRCRLFRGHRRSSIGVLRIAKRCSLIVGTILQQHRTRPVPAVPIKAAATASQTCSVLAVGQYAYTIQFEAVE